MLYRAKTEKGLLLSEATDLDQNDIFRDQPNPNRDIRRMMKVRGGKTKPGQVRYDEHRILLRYWSGYGNIVLRYLEKEAGSGFLARRGLPRPDGLCISRLGGADTVLAVDAL